MHIVCLIVGFMGHTYIYIVISVISLGETKPTTVITTGGPKPHVNDVSGADGMEICDGQRVGRS